VKEYILGILRENGPLNEELLLAICRQTPDQSLSDEEWREEIRKAGPTVLEYLKPFGDEPGVVLIHPGCQFRVVGFR
jgi:hypothetical protein